MGSKILVKRTICDQLYGQHLPRSGPEGSPSKEGVYWQQALYQKLGTIFYASDRR
jgi:hypothetical protein